MIVLDAPTAILLEKAELLDGFIESVRQTVAMPKDIQEECRGRDSLDARLIARAIEEKRIGVKAADRRGLEHPREVW